MVFQRKYNSATVTGSHIRIPMIKRGAVDFALSADWTPAVGDVKIIKDGGAASNITTLPTAVTVGNTGFWEFALSASELSCKQLVVTVADAAPKAVEDNIFLVETFGHANAMIPIDLSDSVRMGMSALPNAAPASAGGLATVDGANRISGIQGAKTSLDSLNDLSAAQVENAVLDADVTTHHVSTGSAGQRINASGTLGDPWSAPLPGGYGVGTAGSILVQGLDAPISSRLADASYSAPDNAGVAAIRSKTDNLPANPAAVGSLMTLDMAQPVPLANASQTVGDALNAARAGGFGTWVTDSLAVPPTLTLYAPDGITPVRTFQLDSVLSPTQRN